MNKNDFSDMLQCLLLAVKEMDMDTIEEITEEFAPILQRGTIRSYEDAGVLTTDSGLRITCRANGQQQQFDITITS
jgi:hypothetical protein